MTNEIRLIVATHLAFYRRHPWLMALFFLGFSLGSALLTAIAGLNQEAKSRYQQSSALISSPVSHLIKPLTGERFLDGEIWLALKRLGIQGAQPVLRGRITTENNKSVAIQGVDTLMWITQNKALFDQTNSASTTQQHNTAPTFALNTLLIDPQFKQRVFTDSGEQLRFIAKNESSLVQPNIALVEDIGLWGITDLANADQLLNAGGKLSFIELSFNERESNSNGTKNFANQADGSLDNVLENINKIIKGRAQLVDAEQQDFDVLSEAFFFNLTALAMLGYIVAAFLSFNAIKLTLTARKNLLKQMHLLGCSHIGINVSLAIELVVVSICTALLGTLGGYVIANALVLDVNRTLIGLYQLDKALVVNWQWSNVALGFVLNILALGIILLAQAKQIIARGSALFTASLVITVAATIWLIKSANTEFQALVLCFCILVFFILLVPKVLSAMASIKFTFTKPLPQWLHADTRFHLKDLHIAIIAILVALGSAIGMQIMVKSFSDTLNAHLEKQLSADIYLRSNDYSEQFRATLNDQNEVSMVSIYQNSEGKVNGLPADLASFSNDVSHYQHISLKSGETINGSHFANNGCLANEQSQIKFAIQLGSLVEFTQNEIIVRCRISGFIYDYGNPSMFFMTLEDRHNQAGLFKEFFGYSIRLKPNESVDLFSERLINQYQQDSTMVMPNKRFKQYANALFNDTFMVTKALNGFILAIALLSLCTSLLSLSANQLKQLQILRNLGVTQKQLLIMKLTQTSSIVLFTSLFAIPLGFALGFALLKFVMPIAFGWTIHFSLDLTTLLLTCLTLVVISAICGYLPIQKLTRERL